MARNVRCTAGVQLKSKGTALPAGMLEWTKSSHVHYSGQEQHHFVSGPGVKEDVRNLRKAVCAVSPEMIIRTDWHFKAIRRWAACFRRRSLLCQRLPPCCKGNAGDFRTFVICLAGPRVCPVTNRKCQPPDAHQLQHTCEQNSRTKRST